MSPVITMPAVPVLGVPEGTKQAGQRVDFRPDQFDLAIETKGYMLAWMRACVCPCSPVVTESKGMPDPNCDLCGGDGWFYFGGTVPQPAKQIGSLDEIQKALVDNNNAMIIRGIMTSIQNQFSPWDKLGNWMSGSGMVTVRHQNKLGFYDKLIGLDVEIAYAQVIEDYDGGDTLETRYMVTGVNLIRSTDKVYSPDSDYHIVKGMVTWYPGRAPNSGTRLAVHYLCHPTWLVVEHPHAARVTSVKFKTANPKTPTGDPRKLPVQALVRYDFIPGP